MTRPAVPPGRPDGAPTSDPLDRIEARARQAVEYEEAGARKDGITPDETWDEWVYGKQVLALIAVARAAQRWANAERSEDIAQALRDLRVVTARLDKSAEGGAR